MNTPSRLAVASRGISGGCDCSRATTSVTSTTSSTSSLPTDPGPHRRQRRDFFRRLFTKQPKEDHLASNEPLSSALVVPRALPRSLSSVTFTRTLLAIWGTRSDGHATAKYGECIAELNTLRLIRVIAVSDAASMARPGVAVTMELATASLEPSAGHSRQAHCALTTTLTSTRPFADCRHLLKLIAFCVEPDCHCGCDGVNNQGCEYQESVRRFLSVCWVRPPLVNPGALGGGGARGIRKGVLAASLNDIVRLARRQTDVATNSIAKETGVRKDAATIEGESRLPRLEAAESYAVTPPVQCRARLEVAFVVRDFMFPRDKSE